LVVGSSTASRAKIKYMDGIDKIEDLYDTFDENVVNNYLIQQLLLYSLSTAISETIDYFESL